MIQAVNRILLKRRLGTIVQGACTLGVLLLASGAAHAACDDALPPMVLTPDSALNRLLECNRDIIDARRLLLSSDADLKIAAEAPNPTLTLGVGGLSPKYGMGGGNYWQKSIDNIVRIDQLIERGQKRELRQATARQLIASASYSVQTVEKQQRIALDQNMVNLAVLSERIRLLNELIDIDKTSLQASQLRLEKKDIPKVDVERQALEMNRAMADLAQTEADRRASQIALSSLLGWEGQAERLQVSEAVLDSVPETLDTAQRLDTEHLVEVLAAKAKVEAATAALALANAQRVRDVSAGVVYEHWPITKNNQIGVGDTLGVSISVPLFVNHQYEGEIARATSDLDAANEALARARGYAQSEWKRLSAQVQTARLRLNLLQNEQLPKSEHVYQTVEFGYKRGAIDLMDVLDARRLLRQSRLEVIEAKADLARAVLEQNEWKKQNEAIPE